MTSLDYSHESEFIVWCASEVAACLYSLRVIEVINLSITRIEVAVAIKVPCFEKPLLNCARPISIVPLASVYQDVRTKKTDGII